MTTTTTTRANAQAMPALDRRAALGTLAAGALLAVPHAAKAASPDADLIALTRKATAKYAELRQFENALRDGRSRFEMPAFPKALVATADDRGYFPRLKAAVGERIEAPGVEVVKSTRETILNLCRLIKVADLGEDAKEAHVLARALEIEKAAQEYYSAFDAAYDAAGLTAIENSMERIEDELTSLWREITFTPALTVEGVMAKVEAASTPLRDGSLDPNECAKVCGPEHAVWMAAADLAAIRATQSV